MWIYRKYILRTFTGIVFKPRLLSGEIAYGPWLATRFDERGAAVPRRCLECRRSWQIGYCYRDEVLSVGSSAQV